MNEKEKDEKLAKRIVEEWAKKPLDSGMLIGMMNNWRDRLERQVMLRGGCDVLAVQKIQIEITDAMNRYWKDVDAGRVK